MQKKKTSILIISLLAIIILSVWGCKSQIPNDSEIGPKNRQIRAPDFNSACSLTHDFSVAKRKLLVHVKLEEGFHAYGEDEKIGRPVRLKIKSNGGWQIEKGPVLPKGVIKDLGILGKSHVIEGDFTIEAWLSTGCGHIHGEVDIQVCTNHFCDRPRTHRFVANTGIDCNK